MLFIVNTIFNKSYYYIIIKTFHDILLNIDNNILQSEIKAIIIIIIKIIIKVLRSKGKTRFLALGKKINNNLNKALNNIL